MSLQARPGNGWTLRFGRRWEVDDRISFYVLCGYDAVPVDEGMLIHFKLGGLFEFRLLPRVWRARIVQWRGRFYRVPTAWRWPCWFTNLSVGIGA